MEANDLGKLKLDGSSRMVTITCRLDTPFLGDIHDRKMLKFDTIKSGDELWLRINTAQWRWALKEAMDSIGILGESSVDFIRLPFKVKAPTVRLYSLRSSGKDNRPPSTHESFQAGTVLTFNVFLLSELENCSTMQAAFKQRPPTKDEVVECFKIIGECIGLSPWGSKTGYGRFSVESSE